MPILNLARVSSGSVGVQPGDVRMLSNDLLSAITAPGYLNLGIEGIAKSIALSNNDLVTATYQNPAGPHEQLVIGLFQPVIENGVCTLVPVSEPGSALITTPGDFAVYTNSTGGIGDSGFSPSDATKSKVVMANGATTIGHMAVFSDIHGTIEDGGAPTSGAVLLNPSADQHIVAHSLFLDQGNVTAGSSGHGGSVVSYPPTAISGHLQLSAQDNAAGDFAFTIRNASTFAGNCTFTLPDNGVAATNFLVTNSALGDQHIASGGLQVDSGNLTASGNVSAIGGGGLFSGESSGVSGSLNVYPGAANTGVLVMQAQANAGNFTVAMQNASYGQSSTLTIPDVGVASSKFVMQDATAAQFINSQVFMGITLQVNGNIDSQTGHVSAGPGARLIAQAPSNGRLLVQATDNAGAFDIELTNDSFAQATILNIPDPGVASAQVVVAPAALVSGNLVSANGTSGLVQDAGLSLKKVFNFSYAGGSATFVVADAACTTNSVVVVNFTSQANPASVLTVTSGAGSFTVVASADPGASAVSYLLSN